MTELEKFMVEQGVIGVFDNPVTLKSGRQSSWYLNWRDVSNDPILLEQVAQFLIQFTKDQGIGVDTFYGVQEGATKLGVLTQYLWAKQQNLQKGEASLAMGRAQEKKHGAPSDRIFIGKPKGRVVVLEDVVTTGGSLIDCLKSLQSHGVNVVAAIALSRRGSEHDMNVFYDHMKALKLPFYALADGATVIQSLIDTKQIIASDSLIQELAQFK